jgi:hypothetical protein
MTRARDLSKLLGTNNNGVIDNTNITLDANEIPNLDASKITTGELANARVADLPASKITSGTFADARLTGITTTHALGSASTPSITFSGDTNTGIFSPTADTIAFTKGGAEAMRINSSGNVQFAGNIGLGGTTPTTSGTGISFPAALSASSDANTLDDYEEGTYTPDVFNNGQTSTFTIRIGEYTKIGNLVTCSITCESGATGNSGSGGALLITAPFVHTGGFGLRDMVTGVACTNATDAQSVVKGAHSSIHFQILNHMNAQDQSTRTTVSAVFSYRT